MTPPRRQQFSAEYISLAVQVLHLLSHETRLEMVLYLAQGEASVSELTEVVDRPQANVSHHLRILRDAGLIQNRREGQYVMYRLNVSEWTQIAEGFFDHLLGGADSVTLQHFRIRRLEGGDAPAAGGPEGRGPEDGGGDGAGD